MESVRSVYYVCLSNSEDSVTSLQDQFNLQIEVYIQFWISFFFFRSLYRLHLFVVCIKMDQQNQTIGFRTWHYKEYCLLLSLVWNNQTAAATTWVSKTFVWLILSFSIKAKWHPMISKLYRLRFIKRPLKTLNLMQHWRQNFRESFFPSLEWKALQLYSEVRDVQNPSSSKAQSHPKPKVIQNPSAIKTQAPSRHKLIQDPSSFNTQVRPKPNFVRDPRLICDKIVPLILIQSKAIDIFTTQQ